MWSWNFWVFVWIQAKRSIKFYLNINKIRFLWIHGLYLWRWHYIIFKHNKLCGWNSSVFVNLHPSPFCIRRYIYLVALEEYPIGNRTFCVCLQRRSHSSITSHWCKALTITTGSKTISTSFVLVLPGMQRNIIKRGSICTELTGLPEVKIDGISGMCFVLGSWTISFLDCAFRCNTSWISSGPFINCQLLIHVR